MLNTEMLTCSSIARSTGRDKETVRRWCRKGELPAFKLGHEWLIKPHDLEVFLRVYYEAHES
jgi:excisionase family DNA binding protein